MTWTPQCAAQAATDPQAWQSDRARHRNRAWQNDRAEWGSGGYGSPGMAK